VEMLYVRLLVLERIRRQNFAIFDRQLSERRGCPVRSAPVRE
jgi:hypothetical protein